jgi:hypothetical protein
MRQPFGDGGVQRLVVDFAFDDVEVAEEEFDELARLLLRRRDPIRQERVAERING